ncbi:MULTISPECIES: hypothetical protein [unclassified Deinococcus]|uniref:hypothetical protein n=1 Tax=unclassified Deinococcus TaxID=2623546 RepID=UPI001C306C29|nr:MULTISPECIES: hypothetical protein [unclassified Deinococcus]MDK2014171.1 hypothetical protein [Deinococcus sp. 43]
MKLGFNLTQKNIPPLNRDVQLSGGTSLMFDGNIYSYPLNNGTSYRLSVPDSSHTLYFDFSIYALQDAELKIYKSDNILTKYLKAEETAYINSEDFPMFHIGDEFNELSIQMACANSRCGLLNKFSIVYSDPSRIELPSYYAASLAIIIVLGIYIIIFGGKK